MEEMKKKRWGYFLSKYMLVFILLALIIALSFAAEHFMNLGNIMTILRNSAMQGIVAFGMTMVIIAGEIDLSVASQIAFSGCLAAVLVRELTEVGMAMGLAIGIAMVVCIVIAYLIGMFIAMMRSRLGVPTFITTLALMTALAGAALLITDGFPVTSFPQEFSFLGAGFIGGFFPFPAIILLVVFFVVFFVLKYTKFGREVYAVGGNVEAARLNGVNINRVRSIIFGVTQALSALSGLIVASQINSGNPQVAKGWEMNIISAVIIGGASLSGGKGSAIGTLIGVLFLGVVLNGMTQLNVNTYWQQVVQGVLVLLAVLLNTLSARGQRQS